MSSREEDINIDELYRLESIGYKGKSLLDTFLTDDWGVPPTSVIFEGTYYNVPTKTNQLTKYSYSK